MTQKDYVKIAAVFKREIGETYLTKSKDCLRMFASRFADMLQQDNSRFDRDKFFRAVYPY